MTQEKQEQPGTQGNESGSPEESTEQSSSERERFSTLVSGAGAPRVRPEPSLAAASPPPRPFVFPSATTSASERTRPSPHAHGVLLAEDFEDDTPASRPVLLAEQVGPLPPSSAGSVRLSLTGTGRNLRGVRVALVDTDPTRTDALATALRARQAEVHVTSFDADRVHIRLLRRFAPHALLIDESVLPSVGKHLVECLRSDPFLGHTQLFPLRLERMYNQRFGVASIETVREFLEPLGRAESELLARLGPHVEVEFELDQFPPHRLLRMLATRGAPTTIQCTREKEMLRWTVVRGRTGHAELYRLGVEAPARLSADEALEWFLGHQNCHVVLTQPTEFDDQTGREVIPMVERQESGLWEAPRPNKRPVSTPGADSLSPQFLRDSTSEGVRSRFAASVGPGIRRLGSSWFDSSWKWIAGAALGAVGVALWIYAQAPGNEMQAAAPPSQVDADTGAPALDSKDLPEDAALDGARLAAPFAPPADVAPPASPSPTDASATTPSVDERQVAIEENGGVGLFAVPAKNLESCEEIVGEGKAPGSVKSQAQLARLSAQHFRAAQKALVGGKTAEAHADLCRAALLDPAGGGTLVLVQYLLAQRDYKQALAWIRKARAARPPELAVEELWGDVLHQAGNPDDALRVWLAALDMEPAETAKRVAVARRFAAHGSESLSGGDYARAERALRRASAFDPESAVVARLLATLFSRQGQREQAERFRAEEARLLQRLP